MILQPGKDSSMTQRIAVLSLVGMALAAQAWAGQETQPGPQLSARKPNIILILTDDKY